MELPATGSNESTIWWALLIVSLGALLALTARRHPTDPTGGTR